MVLAGRLDEIEESTYYALAGMSAARREVRQRTAEFLRQQSTSELFAKLARVDALLAQVLDQLTPDSIEQVETTPELKAEVRRLMQRLEDLYGQMVSLLDDVERVTPPRTSAQSQLLAALRERTDVLGDTLEAYEISCDEEFQSLIRGAISELKAGNPNPVDWKSAIGRLFD